MAVAEAMKMLCLEEMVGKQMQIEGKGLQRVIKQGTQSNERTFLLGNAILLNNL